MFYEIRRYQTRPRRREGFVLDVNTSYEGERWTRDIAPRVGTMLPLVRTVSRAAALLPALLLLGAARAT